jgi:hypothetical protein
MQILNLEFHKERRGILEMKTLQLVVKMIFLVELQTKTKYDMIHVMMR